MSTPTPEETPIATIPDDDVVTTDETVRTTDEMVRTTDETVQTTDEAVAPGVVTLGMAAAALRDELGPLVDAEYLLGKTRFRDVLCARFDLSQATAEELVDELEESGLVRYVDSKEEGSGWHVHLEGDQMEELPGIAARDVERRWRRAA